MTVEIVLNFFVDKSDVVPRAPGCQCQWEEGDSPCVVHGENEDEPKNNSTLESETEDRNV
jgi:hypothetical protein